jgi:hypothetical protein
MKTNKIFLVVLVVTISISWYSRLNVEEDFYGKEKIDIPISIAMQDINGFNPNKSYNKERSLRGVKRRTFIPFVYKYDTLITSSFMYYSKPIE